MLRKTRFFILYVPFTLIAAAGHAESDKIDIENLEKNYWKAKDSEYNIIQNRNFSKSDRFAVGSDFGIALNDPNSSGSKLGLSFQYFFNETWSIDSSFVNYDLKDNDNTVFFRDRFGVTPDHNKTKSRFSLGASWSPIYAKLNLFGEKIIYFDMSLGLFVGNTTYEKQLTEGNAKSSTPHFGFKLSQLFFFSKNMGLRLSYENIFSDQERVRYKPPTNGSDRSLGKSSHHDSSMAVGLVIFN